MEELLEKYQKLDEVRRMQLLSYADKLLTDQQLKNSKGNLSEYEKWILEVSVWSDDDIKEMQDNLKLLGQWKAPEW